MEKSTKIILAIMIISSLLIFTGCKKLHTPLTTGYYSGSLNFQGQLVFDAIIFNGNNYEEVPSGGALNQKFPCLTKGTYQIRGNLISFSPNNSPVCSCSACELKGDYSFIQEGNKITFQKGSGPDVQIYSLTQILE